MWDTPLTAVANTVLTAGQWNGSVRDNLNETTPAKATSAGRWFVTAGTNQIVQRKIIQRINADDSEEETVSTSYTDLGNIGPLVTLESGPFAIVWINATLRNSGATTNSYASYAVTGATTDTATADMDERGLEIDGGSGAWSTRCAAVTLQTTTPGTNIFTMKYRAAAGTAGFTRRRIVVMGL